MDVPTKINDIADQSQAILRELNKLLLEAIKFDEADKSLLQLYDPQKNILRPLAHHGFGDEFLNLFSTVHAFDPSACGRRWV